MILASFGDAVDPALLGEAGLEFAIFDFGGELSVLAMRHWHLLQLLLAGAARACSAFSCCVSSPPRLSRILRPAGRRAVEKAPIEL